MTGEAGLDWRSSVWWNFLANIFLITWITVTDTSYLVIATSRSLMSCPPEKDWAAVTGVLVSDWDKDCLNPLSTDYPIIQWNSPSRPEDRDSREKRKGVWGPALYSYQDLSSRSPAGLSSAITTNTYCNTSWLQTNLFISNHFNRIISIEIGHWLSDQQPFLLEILLTTSSSSDLSILVTISSWSMLSKENIIFIPKYDNLGQNTGRGLAGRSFKAAPSDLDRRQDRTISPAGGDSPADLVVIKLICSSWWKLGLVLMKSGHKKLSCRDKLN